MEIKETAEKNVKFARASFREAKRGANFVKTNLSSLNMGNDKKETADGAEREQGEPILPEDFMNLKVKRKWNQLSAQKKAKYYVVREKAVPEVLLKVVEAKRILDSERATTVQEATEQVGISRSSFYKYKDDIFPFHDQAKGRTVTFILQMDDKPGILSDILRTVAEFRGNILTIHQSIPINGIATLTLSVEILPEAGDAEDMIGQMEQQTGVHYLKILGRE